MKTNIIQIGNSKGIILPSSILRELELSLKSSVDIEVRDESILIKPSPRQGWADAARQMANVGDDEPVMPELFEDEDLSWWTWDEKK